jgi:hypothetical protein
MVDGIGLTLILADAVLTVSSALERSITNTSSIRVETGITVRTKKKILSP